MDALLLAAGAGRRLKERTTAIPKALVEVVDRPLIEYALDALQMAREIERIFVVTGFLRETVVDHLRRVRRNKPLIEVFNPSYEKGNFYSLLQGLEEVGSSWLNLNVDHIFPPALVRHALNRAEYISVVCDFDRPLTPDCMKVAIQRHDRGMVLQKIDKKLQKYDGGYIGMTVIREEGRDAYLDAVARIGQRNQTDAWAEMVLQEVADAGPGIEAPAIVDASGFGWLEIDDTEDLHRAEAYLRTHPAFLDPLI